MPLRALRCTVEITANAVSCPGTWLPRREDVYLTISMLGQTRRTLLTSPIFPLIFHERFYFDKVFYSCFEPSQVVDCLEDVLVLVELVQLSDIYEGGVLLASYETNAREFLYPYPSYTPAYGTHDREVLLERTLDFPGICPKFEFSTKTTMEETATPTVDYYPDPLPSYRRSLSPVSPRRSRSRTRYRARSPSPGRKSTYGRPTVSSISRSRSLSPVRRGLASVSLSDSDEGRPPFVVRKVDSPALIGRRPGSPHPRSRAASPCNHGSGSLSRSPSRTRRKSLPSGYLDGYSFTRPRTQALYDTALDAEVDAILNKPKTYIPPYRPSSPLLYSPLRDYYLDRPYSPYRSELVRARVDRALQRSRSLERLRLDRSLDDLSLERYRRWSMDTIGMMDAVLGTSEYWDELARRPAGISCRGRFYTNLEKIYSDLYNVYKRARSRTQFLGY